MKRTRKRRARKNPASTVLPVVVTAAAAIGGGLLGRLELDKTIQNIPNWPPGHILTSGDPIWQEYIAGGVAAGTGLAAIGALIFGASSAEEGTADGAIVTALACGAIALIGGAWWYQQRKAVNAGQPAELPATPAQQITSG